MDNVTATEVFQACLALAGLLLSLYNFRQSYSIWRSSSSTMIYVIREGHFIMEGIRAGMQITFLGIASYALAEGPLHHPVQEWGLLVATFGTTLISFVQFDLRRRLNVMEALERERAVVKMEEP